jgi:hypothetical protein
MKLFSSPTNSYVCSPLNLSFYRNKTKESSEFTVEYKYVLFVIRNVKMGECVVYMFHMCVTDESGSDSEGAESTSSSYSSLSDFVSEMVSSDLSPSEFCTALFCSQI